MKIDYEKCKQDGSKCAIECMNACDVQGALSATPPVGGVIAIHGPSCTSCGECVDVCPEKAIEYTTEDDGKRPAGSKVKYTCSGCDVTEQSTALPSEWYMVRDKMLCRQCMGSPDKDLRLIPDRLWSLLQISPDPVGILKGLFNIRDGIIGSHYEDMVLDAVNAYLRVFEIEIEKSFKGNLSEEDIRDAIKEGMQKVLLNIEDNVFNMARKIREKLNSPKIEKECIQFFIDNTTKRVVNIIETGKDLEGGDLEVIQDNYVVPSDQEGPSSVEVLGPGISVKETKGAIIERPKDFTDEILVPEEEAIEEEKAFKFEYYRKDPRVDQPDVACRVTHIRTGWKIDCWANKSKYKNKQQALESLKATLKKEGISI